MPRRTDSTSCDLNDPRVRTDVWLEACSFYDRLVELDDHFSIFFTPIRYWGPIQGMFVHMRKGYTTHD